MKLSMVAYECVRNSIAIPNPNMSYATFCEEMASSTDNVGRRFALQLSGVWSALNLAVSRLLNADKIPFLTKTVSLKGNEGPYDENGDVEIIGGEIMNIAVMLPDGTYKNLPFRTKVEIVDGKRVNKFVLLEGGYNQVFIEYKQRIKHFSQSDILAVEIDEGVLNDNNIDMFESYGITNQMCDYIMEFVKGQLMEPVAPEVANMHNNRAEQYFSLLPTFYTAFYQDHVIDVMAKEIL